MKKRITLTIALIMAFTVIAAAPATENVSAAEGLKKPTLTNHAAGKTKIKNTWTKVKGADGYEIFRAMEKDKELKKVKTITNGKTVTWTDKKVKKGKAYYYAVRAYKMEEQQDIIGKKEKIKVYSKFSAEQMAVPTNQPNWDYTLDKKAKTTKTLKITIVNKGMNSMKIDVDGKYLKDAKAFKTWNSKSDEEMDGMEPAELQKLGITPIALKKSITIKPGKKATLTYRSDVSVKYAKTGRIVSQFRSGGKDYGMWNSLKHGSDIWLQ